MNRRNRTIASILLVIMLLSCTLVAFSSCKGKDKDNDGKNNGGAIIGGGTEKTENFSVTVKTEGGMYMEGLPIYVFEYEDGSLGDIVEGVYASTDANGSASFKLPAGKSYAARITFPDGYDAKSYYPLISNTQIVVGSSVITDGDSTGVSYNLGDVMYDFTVTSVDGEKLTLSKLLEEKDAVLLNFWYIECSWCEKEFPFMQSAYEKYGEDIAIIALDPVSKDTKELINNYRDQMGIKFYMAQDSVGLYSAFGVQNYPTSIMIDRYGVITLAVEGAIPNERSFDYIFDHFAGDDYNQILVTDMEDVVPKEKPNMQMPSSDDFAEAFEKEDLGDVNYRNDDKDEFSWPFITGKHDGFDVVVPSNSGVQSSYAQLIFDITLEAGDVVAFDYLASSEQGVDIMYVVVDGKNLFEISGESEQWKTCYAYVAEEPGTYEIGLVYYKDSGDDVGDDTVYLKDLRLVTESEIDVPTYVYRFAATNPDEFSNYQDFANIVYNEEDGYWHVDSKDGPILLANLMGYTRFSVDNYVYNMCLGKDYEAAVTKYCNYASNSVINGLCSVTEELRQLLLLIVEDYGSGTENEWLELCCYFDAYGTDEQLVDPIKGLAPFSAYETILGSVGDNDFPNEIVYNRGIMPRGLFSKFTPSKSGTYLIVSYAPGSKEGEVHDSEGWIFTYEGFEKREVWLTYENVDKLNVSRGADGDNSNCYMMAYLEAGKDYYINIAYADVSMLGTIYFNINYLGGEGVYRLSLASPGPFTSYESILGELTQTIIKSNIDVKLESDGFYREQRNDGRLGSLLYADFTGLNIIFGSKPIYSDKTNIYDLIDSRAFDFRLSEEDLYVLNYLDKVGGDVEKCKADLRAELGDAYNATYTDFDYDGIPYTVNGYAVDDVLAGIYHGNGKDETATMLEYAKKIIKAGDTISILNENGTGTTKVVVQKGSAMEGCVVVDEQLADILQQLMEKYTFKGVENSWLKLCYYEQYFCAATPK